MNDKQDDLITVEGLSVFYANGHKALDHVGFTLKSGVICGLVGANGSGKSTLFKTIMGFLKPATGTVRIAGMPVAQALKQHLVSYVPQSEDIDWNFPVLVEDVVMMGRYSRMGFLRIPSREDREKVTQALEEVGLTAFRRRQIGALSGGQRKRVFLARALAQEARIILLDEPFTGVDIQTEKAIIALLQDLRDRGSLILVSTHNLGSVPDFCDEAILINRRILAAGPIAETFTEANLAEAFGGMLRRVQLGGGALHDDEDPRSVTVITDDERPLVLYGHTENQEIMPHRDEKAGKR